MYPSISTPVNSEPPPPYVQAPQGYWEEQQQYRVAVASPGVQPDPRYTPPSARTTYDAPSSAYGYLQQENSPFAHPPPQSHYSQSTDNGFDVYSAQNSVQRQQANYPSQYPTASEDYESGVVAYEAGPEPYGARGTGNDYLIQTSNYGTSSGFNPVRTDEEFHAKPTPPPAPGAQRFGAKLLPDPSHFGSSDSPKNIICQVALDGVRLMDPKDGTVLRVYPLDSITSWVVKDGTVFTFWTSSKSNSDQRVVRLEATEYTVNNILDAITAACVQLSEILAKPQAQQGGDSPAPASKEKGRLPLLEWLGNKQKGEQVERDHWVPDQSATRCSNCRGEFNPLFNRRHHCRNCGGLFCDKCSQGRTALTNEPGAAAVRVCDQCLAEVTQSLSAGVPQPNSAGKALVSSSHEELARQVQEEMERKSSSVGPRSQASAHLESGAGYAVPVGSRPTRMVACPSCTVHLQVEVPTEQATETVVCGVCQSPFLVTA